MAVSDGDLAHWREWVGRKRTVTERLAPAMAERYAAALGEPCDGAVPSLGHWAWFVDAVQPAQIGADGHPERGGFLPPVTLASRMFAASEIRFDAPLVLDREATLTGEVVRLDHKRGASGDLVLAEVAIAIVQDGTTCVAERQTIIYRDGGGTIAPVADAGLALPAGGERWRPGEVDLFRFSAVTFNSHRIHYDAPYARAVEGYPALVVHGPFTAARLFGFATRRHGPLRSFAFRAQAPLFVGQPIDLIPGDRADEVIARRCDGTTAMVARIAT